MLGSMGVVAQNANTHLNRLVDEPVLGKAVVAGVTQFRIVSGPFELVPRTGSKRRGALLGLMTSVAPVLHQRLVDTSMLHDRRVTIRHGTRRRSRCRGATHRFLGGAACRKSGRDKCAGHHTCHARHARPAKLENPLLHPLRGGCLQLAHPPRLHGLQAPPDHLGQVSHEQIAGLGVGFKEGVQLVATQA